MQNYFFLNNTATTETSTLPLHNALPISPPADRAAPPAPSSSPAVPCRRSRRRARPCASATSGDRKSTRLNSSHGYISYAVFCLKKKNNEMNNETQKEITCIKAANSRQTT